MPLLNLEARIKLALDQSGAPMLCVLVKKVDWWTVVLVVIQVHVLTPMMLELLAILLVSQKYELCSCLTTIISLIFFIYSTLQQW